MDNVEGSGGSPSEGHNSPWGCLRNLLLREVLRGLCGDLCKVLWGSAGSCRHSKQLSERVFHIVTLCLTLRNCWNNPCSLVLYLWREPATSPPQSSTGYPGLKRATSRLDLPNHWPATEHETPPKHEVRQDTTPTLKLPDAERAKKYPEHTRKCPPPPKKKQRLCFGAFRRHLNGCAGESYVLYVGGYFEMSLAFLCCSWSRGPQDLIHKKHVETPKTPHFKSYHPGGTAYSTEAEWSGKIEALVLTPVSSATVHMKSRANWYLPKAGSQPTACTMMFSVAMSRRMSRGSWPSGSPFGKPAHNCKHPRHWAPIPQNSHELHFHLDSPFSPYYKDSRLSISWLQSAAVTVWLQVVTQATDDEACRDTPVEMGSED